MVAISDEARQFVATHQKTIETTKKVVKTGQGAVKTALAVKTAITDGFTAHQSIKDHGFKKATTTARAAAAEKAAKAASSPTGKLRPAGQAQARRRGGEGRHRRGQAARKRDVKRLGQILEQAKQFGDEPLLREEVEELLQAN